MTNEQIKAKLKVTNVDFKDQGLFDDLNNKNSANHENVMLILFIFQA